MLGLKPISGAPVSSFEFFEPDHALRDVIVTFDAGVLLKWIDEAGISPAYIVSCGISRTAHFDVGVMQNVFYDVGIQRVVTWL